MMTKIVIGVLAAVGVTFGGVYYATAQSQPDCCFPGSPCCEDEGTCCLNQPTAKVTLKATCCTNPEAGLMPDCCFPGSPCCDDQATCCLNQQPAAKAENATKASCCSEAKACGEK